MRLWVTFLATCAAGFLLVIATSATALAADVEIHKVYVDRGRPTALVSVFNTDVPEGYSGIVIECTFLSRGSIVGVGEGVLNNIAYRQRGTRKVRDHEGRYDFDSAQCRVSDALRN
jgi:hypothetical protein